MKVTPFTSASLLALVLALGLAARIYSQHAGFRKVVNESLATSEGYDQQFINLVNHLEEVLTTRAGFPYPGGKDPMTGRRREMAAAILETGTSGPAATASKPTTQKPAKFAATKVEAAPASAQPLPDRVRLTAIIADDYGQHTAIVMEGERSLSVDVGDAVGDRRVTRITSKELTMEDGVTIYTYGLSGTRNQQRK